MQDGLESMDQQGGQVLSGPSTFIGVERKKKKRKQKKELFN